MTLDEWLRDYPQSPLGVLATLLGQFRAGERDAESFVQALDVFQAFLEDWAETLSDGELEPDTAEKLLAALQGLAEAALGLREYAENGEEELADNAVGLAMNSQELLLDVMSASHENPYEL